MERCPYFIDNRFRVETSDSSQRYTVGEIACMHPNIPLRLGSICSTLEVTCEGDSTNCEIFDSLDSP